MSNAALLANFLFVGPLIEARLASMLPSNTPIEGIERIAQAGAEDNRPRVVYVLYDGYSLGDSVPHPHAAAQIMNQRWLVLLKQLHASAVAKDARAQTAGPLLSEIFKALIGWKPAGSERPMRIAPGRAPNYSKQSGIFPLAFHIDLHL